MGLLSTSCLDSLLGALQESYSFLLDPKFSEIESSTGVQRLSSSNSQEGLLKLNLPMAQFLHWEIAEGIDIHPAFSGLIAWCPICSDRQENKTF